MSRKLYFFIYSLFLIVPFLYGGSLIVASFNLRLLLVLIMFFICIKEHALRWDKYITLYLLFVISYLFSSIVSGYPLEALKRVISYYFASYIAYCSTVMLFNRYSGEKFFVIIFIIFGFADALFSIGQLLNLPQIETISSTLGLKSDEYLEEMQERSDFGIGYYIPGLFGVVYNGYMLMTITILSFYSQRNHFNIIGLIITVILLVACFVVQEISSFLLAIVISTYLIVVIMSYKSTSNFIRLFFLLSLSLFAIWALYQGFGIMMSGTSRMASVGFDLTGRDSISKTVMQYIGQYPIFAGFERFVATYNTYPHNLFLNAYVYGGFLGFIFIIILLIEKFKVIFKYFFPKFISSNLLLSLLCLSYLAYTTNSLVHNNSLVAGDMIIWMLWGAIISLLERDSQNQPIIILNEI